MHVNVSEHKHRLVDRPPRPLLVQPLDAAEDGASIVVGVPRQPLGRRALELFEGDVWFGGQEGEAPDEGVAEEQATVVGTGGTATLRMFYPPDRSQIVM